MDTRVMSVFDESGDVLRGEARRRRRSWSVEEKRRIVAESYAAGSSVSLVARRHDVNANMLFTWRRAMRTAASDAEGVVRFLPATITDRTPAPGLASSSAAAGRMEIVLAGGDRVIVGADVEAAALLRVVKILVER